MNIINSDSRGIPIRDRSVDLVLTSPPYNCGCFYDEKWNDSMDMSDYWCEVDSWCDEFYRVSKPMGFAVINVAIDIKKKERRRNPHRTRVPVEPIALPWIEKMKISGWDYRGSHLWHKFHDPENVYYHTPRNGTHKMPAISGAGTTVVVARKLGRVGIGCEISIETIMKSLFYINQMDMFTDNETVDMTV